MIIVIFCGGSGTRLWPLSTHHNPKQLVNIVGDKSPLQNTYERARNLTDQVYVLPEKRLLTKIREQLPHLEEKYIINEPGLRGTASCVVAALDLIGRSGDTEEPIAFIHADHHIRDTQGFMHTLNLAAKTTTEHKSLTLVGPEPTYAATIFGYIKKDTPLDSSETVYTVSEFKEKPDFETANSFLASGKYLWNCGYFVAGFTTFIDTMKTFAPKLYDQYRQLNQVQDINSQEYIDTYLSFDNDAIDYALIEKVRNLLVVPATFDWADIGSFGDAHTVSELDEKNNYIGGQNIHTIDIENSYVRNEEDKPIAVIGLDNIVVINTPNGILVARKDISNKVGEIAKKIQSDT